MNIFFMLDDSTDVLELDGVTEVCQATVDAIDNPDKPRPSGETILGEMTRQ